MTETSPRSTGANRDPGYPVRAATWALVVLVAVCCISNNNSLCAQEQQAAETGSQEAQTPASLAIQNQPQRGSISGTVVDQDGAVIANVTVILARPDLASTSATSKLEVPSDGEGHFIFADVPPGPFQLSFGAPGFAPLEKSGLLHPGENYAIPQIALAVAENTVDVEVTLTQEQIAEDQIKVEEKQRLLGILPNFYVSYNPKAVALSAKQKFKLAWKSTIDPVSFAIVAGVAGIEQADNAFSGYGPGAQGYAKRFGAAYADEVVGTFIGSAILPSLLKQDPRYFYKGTGSRKSRFFYAVANAVVCKGDDRRWQPNYSFIIGDLASGGISNLYYPAQNRNGAALTFENTAIAIGAGAIGNVFQEFFSRKLTPHAPPSPQ